MSSKEYLSLAICVATVNKEVYANMANNGNDMKYATLRVKYETQERVNLYIAERMVERDGKRITVDDVVNEAFDALKKSRATR